MQLYHPAVGTPTAVEEKIIEHITTELGEAAYASKIANHKQADRVAGPTHSASAEVGKYVIFYHVTDNAGNHECTTFSRTVIVRDTLSPVIALHYNKKLIQVSDTTDIAKETNRPDRANPAGHARTGGVGNPYLMAEESETSGVNGWVVGAAASAVAGFALLASPQRKSVATTV